MIPIYQHETIGGVRVPLAEDGEYLDWRHAHDGVAPYLESPYGFPHFVVGSAAGVVTLDFAELPDGRFALKAYAPTTPQLRRYEVATRGRAAAVAFGLVEFTLDGLRRLAGSEHSPAWAKSTPDYFVRAVAKAAGSDVYKNWTDLELRHGREE
jgi:hypothetical protein